MSLSLTVVGTYGIKCGVATYTEELLAALSKREPELRIRVLTPYGEATDERDAREFDKLEIERTTCWHRSSAGTPEAIAQHSRGSHVVHFQHEHGIFQNGAAFIQMLFDLRRQRIPTVVTLHTVKPYGDWDSTGFWDAVRTHASVVVTHTVQAYAALCLAQGKARVVHIPHGSKTVRLQRDRRRGLELLKLPKWLDRAVVGGAVGFVGPGKNLVTSLRAFCKAKARKLIPDDVCFLVCGDVGVMQQYAAELQHISRESGYSDRIFLRFGFIPRNDVKHVMALLDYGVLNTTSWTLSASGQVHLYASYGIPLAVANRPIYLDGVAAGCLPFEVPRGDPHRVTDTLLNAIAALSSDSYLRDSIRSRMLDYARLTSWERLSDLYLKIYNTFSKER